MARKKKSAVFITFLVCIALFLLYLGSFFLFPDVSALSKKNPDLTAFMKYRMGQWEEAGKKNGSTGAGFRIAGSPLSLSKQ
jgi:hypothetical protein